MRQKTTEDKREKEARDLLSNDNNNNDSRCVLFIESLLCSRHCAWLDFPWFMTFSYCEVAEVL